MKFFLSCWSKCRISSGSDYSDQETT